MGCYPYFSTGCVEHAYYLDYQNRRKDYIEAWWHVVDRAEVEKRLHLAPPAQVPLSKAYI